MISHEGFELVFIPNEDNAQAAAFIGYRKLNLLRTGPMIYIDDLFTFAEFRGRGYAGALLDYVARRLLMKASKLFILIVVTRCTQHIGYILTKVTILPATILPKRLVSCSHIGYFMINIFLRLLICLRIKGASV